MKTAKHVTDSVIFLLLAFVFYVFIKATQFLAPPNATEAYFLTLATTLIPAMAGSLASISGILIAVYLLSSQMSGRRPYSRLVKTFYDTNDLYYFGIFFISLLALVYTHAFWKHISISHNYYWLDICLILYTASILSIVSLMLKHFSIFNPRLVAERVLQVFSVRNVLAYGLVSVEKNSHDDKIMYRLKTWGHRHNLADPLGPFHDILMETIEAKERITFHLYLSVFTERLAYLNGVRFERKFGLATGPKHNQPFEYVLLKFPILFGAKNLEDKVSLTVHALHYLVRRSKKMITEWGLDNHRQIFIINIADLVLALARKRNNGVLIEICLDVLLKICIDYQSVSIYGSYEPLKDLFQTANELKRVGYNREANLCLQVLAFLDINTHYISPNKNVDLKDVLSRMPSELITYFDNQKIALAGKSLGEAFERNLWVMN